MKRTGLISIGLVLLVVVVGAAYVGGQLLNGQAAVLPNGQVINFGLGSGSRQRCEVKRVSAAELPHEPPLTEMGVIVLWQAISSMSCLC